MLSFAQRFAAVHRHDVIWCDQLPYVFAPVCNCFHHVHVATNMS